MAIDFVPNATKNKKRRRQKRCCLLQTFFVLVCLYTWYCFAFALRALTVQEKQLLHFSVVKVWRIVALPSASDFVTVLQTFATVCAKTCNFTVEDVHRLSAKLLPTCVRLRCRRVQGHFPTGTVRQPLLWRCRKCRLLLPSDKVSL